MTDLTFLFLSQVFEAKRDIKVKFCNAFYLVNVEKLLNIAHRGEQFVVKDKLRRSAALNSPLRTWEQTSQGVIFL